jgi:exoribonuclease R
MEENQLMKKRMKPKCLHSSTMEGLATNAERDSIKYMQVKYMQDHQDQEFFGRNFWC